MIGSPRRSSRRSRVSNVKLQRPLSFPFLFVSAIPFRALNLQDCVAIWDIHLLSFVPFTLTQHLTKV
jgi:hypothetical protein